MIKNIYNKNNKYYKHKYYCDNCFFEIKNREIFRNEKAIKYNKFDLCSECNYLIFTKNEGKLKNKTKND